MAEDTTGQPEQVVRAFVAAIAANDLAAARALLTDSFIGYVTTADGGTREADADAYVASLEAMDIPTADLRLDIKDATGFDPRTVLVMVEVHAERGGRSLHNFSGQLATVADGRIDKLWMVDAKPLESDRFWASPA
jgi:hypothetical protein